MSHIVSIKTEIHDLEAVKATCQELGLTFKANQTQYAWWGRVVGDSPLPEGFTTEDLGKCEHAIGVPGTTWEIGLAKPRNGRGYRLLFDYFGHWGKPILEALGGQGAGKFLQLYAVHKATLEAKRRGYIVRRQPAKNGAINLVVTGL